MKAKTPQELPTEFIDNLGRKYKPLEHHYFDGAGGLPGELLLVYILVPKTAQTSNPTDTKA